MYGCWEVSVNGGGGHVFEKQLQIPCHGVLGVGLWVSYLLLMVAAGGDHAPWRSIMGTLNSLPHEVKLSSSDHVFNVWDVIEYVSHLGILIRSSFTHVMLMARMRWMLRCRKTSSLLSRLCQSNHVSQPHSSRFIGIARKRRYLL